MISIEQASVLPEDIKSARYVITEHIKGDEVLITVTEEGVTVESLVDVNIEDSMASIMKPLESCLTTMFKDVKEMVMEQHKVCDYVESEGYASNRPDLDRDFQSITIRATVAGGEHPAEGVPVLKEGGYTMDTEAPYYSQDRSLYATDLYVDGKIHDFYTMGSLCSSFGIPLAPVLEFADGVEEAIKVSTGSIGNVTVVANLQPLLDEDGKPVLDEEGDFTHLPVIPDNTKGGHEIRPVYPIIYEDKPLVILHEAYDE